MSNINSSQELLNARQAYETAQTTYAKELGESIAAKNKADSLDVSFDKFSKLSMEAWDKVELKNSEISSKQAEYDSIGDFEANDEEYADLDAVAYQQKKTEFNSKKQMINDEIAKLKQQAEDLKKEWQKNGQEAYRIDQERTQAQADYQKEQQEADNAKADFEAKQAEYNKQTELEVERKAEEAKQNEESSNSIEANSKKQSKVENQQDLANKDIEYLENEIKNCTDPNRKAALESELQNARRVLIDSGIAKPEMKTAEEVATDVAAKTAVDNREQANRDVSASDDKIKAQKDLINQYKKDISHKQELIEQYSDAAAQGDIQAQKIVQNAKEGLKVLDIRMSKAEAEISVSNIVKDNAQGLSETSDSTLNKIIGFDDDGKRGSDAKIETTNLSEVYKNNGASSPEYSDAIEKNKKEQAELEGKVKADMYKFQNHNETNTPFEKAGEFVRPSMLTENSYESVDTDLKKMSSLKRTIENMEKNGTAKTNPAQYSHYMTEYTNSLSDFVEKNRVNTHIETQHQAGENIKTAGKFVVGVTLTVVSGGSATIGALGAVAMDSSIDTVEAKYDDGMISNKEAGTIAKNTVYNAAVGVAMAQTGDLLTSGISNVGKAAASGSKHADTIEYWSSKVAETVVNGSSDYATETQDIVISAKNAGSSEVTNLVTDGLASGAKRIVKGIIKSRA